MSDSRDPSSPSRPRPVPSTRSSEATRGRSPSGDTASRATSTARLASPVPTSSLASPSIRQVPTPSQLIAGQSGAQTPLPGAEGSNSLPGPGQSALAAALQSSFGRSPPRFGTPPLRPLSPPTAGAALQGSGQPSNYGSFENRSVQGASGWAGTATLEDREIIKRHLVQPSNALSPLNDGDDNEDTPRRLSAPNTGASPSGPSHNKNRNAVHGRDDDEFSSLQLQGGDVTRQVYRWTEDAEAQSQGGRRGQRSQSFHISRPQPQSDVLDINAIKVPGGFRRNFLRRVAGSPSPTRQDQPSTGDGDTAATSRNNRPRLFTSSFLEFLTLYGHFAGAELEEDDEDLLPGEYFSPAVYTEGGYEYSDEDTAEYGEDTGLLTPGRRKRMRKSRGPSGEASTWGTALTLLKSFVGTGVLFLPKAFLNGGMLFSSLVLLAVACLSYYCFVLLVNARIKAKEGHGSFSFSDLGGKLYGRPARIMINCALVLSQIGFTSAYIVFTSENLQAFFLAVTDCHWRIAIWKIILMQLIIFLPLSLFRAINKLGFIAVVADGFILVGLIYIYYYDIRTMDVNHGMADIVNFNSRDWTLFIGTAIFTFEGVGLIIPIQEGMKKPEKFPIVLASVVIICAIVFTSIGAVSYAAYGSATKTVILLNLPQDDKFVNAVQFLYSLAILLSTPLQLFPAIRIMETELFTRSGKHNWKVKWYKNGFRFFMVMLCGGVAYGGAGDLDKFVALVGSFACIPLVYIFPPALHIRAIEQTKFTLAMNYFLMALGVAGMVYTSTLTITHWIGGVAVKSPGYCDH